MVLFFLRKAVLQEMVQVCVEVVTRFTRQSMVLICVPLKDITHLQYYKENKMFQSLKE